MDAQAFTQSVGAFIAGVAFMNILITFIKLAVEEMEKCSIIGKGRGEKITPFRKNKTYAVVRPAKKMA